MVIRPLKKKPYERSSATSMPPRPMPTGFPPFSMPILRPILILLIVSSILIYIFSKVEPAVGDDAQTQIYSIGVVKYFPHDRRAFTQGLVYGGNDTLFESTGLYGRSSVRAVALRNGKVKAYHEMDSTYFGEGLTLLEDRLFQLHWLRKTGFIYDRYNLNNVETFNHDMKDGWGLATDGNVLYGSDGTSTLYQIDPRTFKVIFEQTVKYKDNEVHNLNELEFVNGEVWANVYQTDCIAMISQNDGIVRGWILLSDLRNGLLADGEKGIDVLNGIAWDNVTNRIFVTGKLWPRVYEIKLKHPRKPPSENAIKEMCIRELIKFY